MGEKAIKGKAITKVLSCLVVIVFLMSTFSVAVIATDSSNSTASNVTDKANSSVESIALSNNITCLTCRDDLIQININKTETVVNESGNSDLPYASNTSSPDIINESDEVPDPDLPVINDTDIDTATAKTVSAMSSCSYVWIKITDKYCYGYKVYVDGVYQFIEGGAGGVLDGYCHFTVTPGYHTFKLTLNGKEVSNGWNCQCGHVYNWMSMNKMDPHWCERPDQCKNPPTVSFDKSKYYEGDTVHATVSTSLSSVYYKIKDCSGTIRGSGYTSNGGSIYYTIPTGASECCYWEICFYWDEGTPPIGLLGTGGEVTTESYQCSKCYSFYVCPKEPCKVLISVEDKYCEGYKVYVDGGYVLTENGDGHCELWVAPGTHKFELRKDGCSVSKSWYCQCGTVYHWVSMNDMYPHWCECNKPDLVVQDIWWSPSSPKEGDTVTFTVKTKNQGSESAGGFYVCYYVDGSYYTRDYVSSLSAGSTTTTSFSWTADCGSHSIKAVADCYDAVAESNEGNNARTEYINIVCKPDLITQDISWSPSSPKMGDTVTINVKTKNKGSESVGEFYVCYYVDGSYYTRDYVSSLSAGSTTTTSFSWTADCGSHAIKAVADCYDAVAESDEENNCRSKGGLNIPCNPDLIIQDIFLSPSNPKEGETVTFTIKTKNQGSENAGGFYVGYYVDGSYYDRDYVGSLSAGSTTTTSFTTSLTWTVDEYGCKCGSILMKTVADCYNAVAESNETNNDASYQFRAIYCIPDLIIQDISWDKNSPKQGDTITFTVKIKNKGADSAGSSTVKYYIDGSYVASDSVPSLSVGSISTQTFTWTANKCGNIPVAAVADTSYAVDESNEGNNRRVETVHVECPPKEKPDLTIQSISVSPPNPKLGDNAEFTVTVKNIGKGTAKKSTSLIYLINGDKQTLLFLDFPSCPPLKPGVTHTYTKNAKIEDCGEYRFRAFVDVSKEVDESNEENNRRVKSFTVPCPKEKPDLTIQSITWEPKNLKQGDHAEFHIYIKNVGKGAAKKSNASVIVKRAISKEAGIWETILDTTYLVPSLEPGKIFDDYQEDVRINKCGEYKITVFVDAKHELDESDTDNNFATKSFSISGIPIYIDVHNVKTSNGYLNLPGAGTLCLYVYDSTLKRDADIAYVNFKNSPAYITVPIKVSEDIKYIRVKQWPAIKDGMFEDWGLMQISPITKNKVYTYIRSNPWITDVTFNGKHSWEVIDLNKKQEVPIRVTVKNPSANELKVKVEFYLDRNEEEAWDYSAVSDSVSIQPKGSHEFTFTYNKESTKGTWRYRVIARAGKEEEVTDQYAWTRIKGSNEKYFDPKVDGYSFSNGEAADRIVTMLKNREDSVLKYLNISPINDIVRKYYKRRIKSRQEGVCVGMSISSALYYIDEKYSLMLKPVDKPTHDMQLENIKVLQRILYYQDWYWDFLDSLFHHPIPNEHVEYQKIKDFANKHDPMLLSLGIYNETTEEVDWLHQVVGIRPCQEEGGYAYVEAYDSNYPDRTSIIKIDISGGNRIYYGYGKHKYKYMKFKDPVSCI